MEYVSDEKVTTKNKRNPSLHELAHNQDVMKRVLRTISRYPSKHNELYGYGHLNPDKIFSKKKKGLEDIFYDDIIDTKSKSTV